MPRLLVVGNSISEATTPGAQPSPALLEARLPGWTIERVIKGGATVEDLEGEARAALATRPDAFVLQVGITDCAPRPLSRRERAVLGRVRPLRFRDRIIQLLHDYRPQIITARRRLRQFTPPDRFAASVGRILHEADACGCETLVLPITRVAAVAEGRTPYTNREVARYNDILQTLSGAARFVTESALLGDTPAGGFCVNPEDVHLDEPAHRAIAAYVTSWLEATRRRTKAAGLSNAV